MRRRERRRSPGVLTVVGLCIFVGNPAKPSNLYSQTRVNYEERFIANQSLITLNTSVDVQILDETMHLHYLKAILTDILGGRHAIAP